LEAGILVRADPAEAAATPGPDLLSCAHSHFREYGYVNMPEALHPFQVEALAAYFHRATEHAAVGDAQCPRRVGMHNENLARFVHRQLLPLAQAVADEPVIPSYCYFAGYRAGASLDRHTDREQCELTISLLIRYEPRQGGKSDWPLFLETGAGPVTLRQRVGDAVLFRGRDLPHWRPALPDGHISDSLLLHFVPRTFTGCLR
jgi:hypothetical protein